MLGSGAMTTCTACTMPAASSTAHALDSATYAAVCAADPTPCAAGFFANLSAETGCSKCPLDTYKAIVGDSKSLCLSCPNQTFTAASGTDDEAKCLALPVESMNYLPDALVAIGIVLFAINSCMACVDCQRIPRPATA